MSAIPTPTSQGGTSATASVLNAIKANPLLAATIASGVLGGAAGGYLTAKRPRRDGESSGQRTRRILRNMLLLGGASAAGVGGLGYGARELATAVPEGEATRSENLMEGGVRAGGAAAGFAAARKFNAKHENAAAHQILTSLGQLDETEARAPRGPRAPRAPQPATPFAQGSGKRPPQTPSSAAPGSAAPGSRFQREAQETMKELKLSPRQFLRKFLKDEGLGAATPGRGGRAGQSFLGGDIRRLFSSVPRDPMSGARGGYDRLLLQAGINPAYMDTAAPSFGERIKALRGPEAVKHFRELRRFVTPGATVAGLFAPELLGLGAGAVGGVGRWINPSSTMRSALSSNEQ